jgi:hypothetical protein
MEATVPPKRRTPSELIFNLHRQGVETLILSNSEPKIQTNIKKPCFKFAV